MDQKQRRLVEVLREVKKPDFKQKPEVIQCWPVELKVEGKDTRGYLFAIVQIGNYYQKTKHQGDVDISQAEVTTILRQMARQVTLDALKVFKHFDEVCKTVAQNKEENLLDLLAFIPLSAF